MRWQARPELVGDEIRVVRRFLFIPMCLGGEWRWLEHAGIKQMYDVPDYADMGEGGWKNMEWVE